MIPTLSALFGNLFIKHYPTTSSIKDTAPNDTTSLDFSALAGIGPVTEGVFDSFKIGLSRCLQSQTRLTHLTLSSRNSRNSLPQCTNHHLSLIGKHCAQLVFLDISFNRGLTGEHLKHLIPKYDTMEQEESDEMKNKACSIGCPDLTTLYIFDCGFFDKDVATVAGTLYNLHHLGYKEAGKVVKHIYRNILSKTGGCEKLGCSSDKNAMNKSCVSENRCKETGKKPNTYG